MEILNFQYRTKLKETKTPIYNETLTFNLTGIEEVDGSVIFVNTTNGTLVRERTGIFSTKFLSKTLTVHSFQNWHHTL